ncbi:hypothetical protein VKT23_015908 [Stygiomarasmius scandens]|uniref:Uncharacterized protein n=1 Tax=Marasmiellus scandens TaxID=2682957 RepID=A0ABR1IZ64_9AGAR
MRYPTLASLPDIDQVDVQLRETLTQPLEHNEVADGSHDDATVLEPTEPSESLADTSRYLDLPPIDDPLLNVLPRRNSSQISVQIEGDSVTADETSSIPDPTVLPSVSSLGDQRSSNSRNRAGHRVGRKGDKPYRLPDYSPNGVPRFKERFTRQAFPVRFYTLCSDDHLDGGPPLLQQTLQDYDLFLHIHRTGVQRDLHQPEEVLFRHVQVWCFSQHYSRWERIRFGQQKSINGTWLALTLSKQLEPSWVLPQTMGKDKRWKRLATCK